MLCPRIIAHLDANGVTSFQKRRFHFARLDFLDHPHFGDAAVTEAAISDRFARTAIGIAVGYRSRSDNRPSAQIAGFRQMRDQHAEIEGAIIGSHCPPEWRTVEIDHQRPAQFAIAPIVAETFGRHQDRRQSARGFRLDETKALFQFGRNEVSQRYIVHQSYQSDIR